MEIWRLATCGYGLQRSSIIELSMCGGDAAFLSNYFDHLLGIIIRTHRSTTYVDAAYCYRLSSVVCRSVCHNSEPCKKGCTDQDAVWVEYSGWPREPCIRWGSRSPTGRDNLEGEGPSHCKV